MLLLGLCHCRIGEDSSHCGTPSRVQFVLHGQKKAPSKVVFISDTNVWPLYGESLQNAFSATMEKLGLRGVVLLDKQLPPGEQTKCRAVKAEIEDWMIASGCRRDTVVVAVGGGVVGDLAGFVAATFMRGVPVVQVPTSLLAMVDSSIGGKTAIDIPSGKNLVGAFHQPAAVFIDLSVLPSLPVRHFCNGMAEVIKTAAIADAELFQLLEASCHTLLALASTAVSAASAGTAEQWGSADQRGVLQAVISRTAGLKVSVVNRDEKEGGLRAILNFGHTVGHGIEALLAPDMLHGEAVAVGLVKEAEAARDMGRLGHDAVARIQALCKAFKLPVRVPLGLSVPAIAAGMAVDKKNTGADAHPRAVLLADIGAVHGPPHAQPVHSQLWARLLSHSVQISAPPPGSALGTPDAPLRVNVPGSKSLTNRALLLAGLAEGETVLTGVLLSDDTLVMIAALSSMGVPCSWETMPSGERALRVSGNGGRLQLPASRQVFVNNAGTAARFLASALCMLPASEDGVVLDGNARMRQRPIGDLVTALHTVTAPGTVAYEGQEGFLPLRIRGGGLRSGVVTMKGKVSSQFVSSLLMAGACAAGAGGTPFTLQLEEEHPTSLPYITMTAKCMQAFGVPVLFEADNRYVLQAGSAYAAPASGRYAVEPDASSATYPAAWAAVTGGAVFIPGLVRAASTQGDVGFLSLLEGMGARVVDVPPSDSSDGGVVVAGPAGGAAGGGLAALPGDTNMEDCTDAFLTMAAVAAGAVGTTRITGVANQRVKECNRITALATEFAKCGVDISELPDGLVIRGKGGQSEPEGGAAPPSVHGYDDHRVAMSLAVLTATGTLPCSAVCLDDAWCVEKTYPTFWADWTTVLSGGAVAPDSAPAAPQLQGSVLEQALPCPVHSVAVLIGMRGVGKSHLAEAAAARLGVNWRVVDIDAEIVALAGGQPPAEIVQAGGWERFRALEVQALQHAMGQHVPACGGRKPTGPAAGVIIACGGGVVESEAARLLLQSASLDTAGEVNGAPVFWLRRELEHLAAELGVQFDAGSSGGASSDRPAYGEGFGAVYQRRAPWFEACSSHTFDALPVENGSSKYDWDTVQDEFVAALARAGVGACEGGVISTPPTLHTAPGSKFVCFTAPDIPKWAEQAAKDGAAAPSGGDTTAFIRSVTAGVDAVEVRLDLLEAGQAMATAASLQAKRELAQQCMRQVAWLRRRLFPEQQVIATVRSSHEGGRFQVGPHAEPERVENMLQLLQAAAAGGCEYVDVETWMAPGVLGCALSALRIRGARVLASRHITTHTPDTSTLTAVCDELEALGTDVVKVVVMATHPRDVTTLQVASEGSRRRLAAAGRGMIALAMGDAGRASRVWNTVLTPVTHAAMPSAAAPGQLTAAQVNELALWQGLAPEQSLMLFGSPISASPSPAMHGALFQWAGLPHTYGLTETSEVEQLRLALSSGGVQGGNVTIPLKQVAISIATQLTPAAEAIGALNTLYRAADGCTVLGDNTDWLGMARPLQAALATCRAAAPTAQLEGDAPLALILGAGGTARAACFAARSLGLLPVVWNRTADKASQLAATFGGTMVSSLELQALRQALQAHGPRAYFAAVLDTLPPTADVALPAAVLCSEHGVRAAVLVATYAAATEHALTVAALGAACPVVTGRDMIVQQGVAAFSRWTGGRVAPLEIAAAAVQAALQ